MKITNEFKTGLTVIVAIAIGVYFWFKTAPVSQKPYSVKTYFTYAEGVKPDSVVKLAGIEVGRVTSIKFEYEPQTRVELVLELSDEAKVREDSIAFISTSGIVGDAFIGLTSGTAGKPFAAPGTVLPSEDPVELRKLMKKVEVIAESIDKTLVDVQTLAKSFTGVGENLNGLLKDNRSRIDNIAKNLEQTSVNFTEFSDDIKKHPWKLLMKGSEK